MILNPMEKLALSFPAIARTVATGTARGVRGTGKAVSALGRGLQGKYGPALAAAIIVGGALTPSAYRRLKSKILNSSDPYYYTDY